MSSGTFIGQRRFLWLWISAAALVVLAIVYRADHPIGGRNGGTRIGIIYGLIALAGVAFLMWYGVRRRYSYARGSGTLKGWLGAHVWIGLSLAFLVPMHSGFRLEWNLHGAAYLLMLATIGSGLWGAWAYAHYPARLRAQIEGVTNRALVEKLERLDRGVSAVTQGKSDAFLVFFKQLDVPFRPSVGRLLLGLQYPSLQKEDVRLGLSRIPDGEYEAGLELASLAYDAHRLRNELVQEVGLAARMRIWLYAHVPLSFACVFAVVAHVFWVVFFRSTIP